MKIGLTLLFSRELPFGGEFVAFVARLAEELGFDSVWLPEHVVIPVAYQSRYPYTKEGLPGDEQWPDPLACLTYAAAVTKRLRLGTCVAILPEHNPLELAKRLATIDALSGGRLLYGIGSGWLREECDGLFGGDHRDAGLYSKGFRSITTSRNDLTDSNSPETILTGFRRAGGVLKAGSLTPANHEPPHTRSASA